MPSTVPSRHGANPTDPDLAGFTLVRRPHLRALVRRGYEAHLDLFLDPSTAPAVEHIGGGRELHAVIPLPQSERAVVRRYRRGGAIRHFNRDRYFLGRRAFDEARLTERAARSGVAVPHVLAAIEHPRNIGYRAALVTRLIAGARELPAWLAAAPTERRALALRAAGAEIARMHSGGIAHPDLNLKNLLVVDADDGADPAIYIIDFDRGRSFDGAVPLRFRRRDLLRLHRSARKLAAPIDARAWEGFREGYGRAWPLRGSLG